MLKIEYNGRYIILNILNILYVDVNPPYTNINIAINIGNMPEYVSGKWEIVIHYPVNNISLLYDTEEDARKVADDIYLFHSAMFDVMYK